MKLKMFLINVDVMITEEGPDAMPGDWFNAFEHKEDLPEDCTPALIKAITDEVNRQKDRVDSDV